MSEPTSYDDAFVRAAPGKEASAAVRAQCRMATRWAPKVMGWSSEADGRGQQLVGLDQVDDPADLMHAQSAIAPR